MIITPTTLASNLFYINESPINLNAPKFRHLLPIYNNPHNSVLLKFARQTHKSTTACNLQLLNCIKIPSYACTYICPTGKQVSVFSTDKLQSAIRNSPIIQKHYIDKRTADQIFYKEFTNNSKIYLRSAFHTADSIRGISCDKVVFDEAQDLVSDIFSTVLACMTHSMAKWLDMKETISGLPLHAFRSTLYAGTPKTNQNSLEKYWTQSTCCEWVIKCTHCNHYNIMDENNVGDQCLICNKCDKPIHYDNGQWISMNSKGKIHGYRLPAIVLDWINNEKYPEFWQTNVIEFRATESTEKYFNEILALPYANAKNPLCLEDIKLVCKDYALVDDPTSSDLLKRADMVVAGIDWGHGDSEGGSGTSFSILSIGVVIQSRFKLIFMKRYTGRMSAPLPQIEDMYEKIQQYGVSFTIADWGDGRTSNNILSGRLGARNFAELYEHGTMAKKIKFDATKGIYVINRTQMMVDIFMEMKRNQVDFFNYEQFQQFSADFLGIYSEYSEQTLMTKFDHQTPDDGFHGYMFCRIAAMIVTGQLNKYLLGSEGNFDDDGSDNARSF